MLDLTLNPSGTSCTSCNYPLTCRLKYHSCAKKLLADPTKVFSTKDCTPNEVLGVKRQMPGVKLSQMILCVLVRATCSRVDKNQLNYYSFVSKGVNFNARVDNQWPASCSSAFDSVTYVANLVVQ